MIHPNKNIVNVQVALRIGFLAHFNYSNKLKMRETENKIFSFWTKKKIVPVVFLKNTTIKDTAKRVLSEYITIRFLPFMLIKIRILLFIQKFSMNSIC